MQAVLIGKTNGAKYLVGDFSSSPRGLTCPDFGDHATVLGVVGINLAASVLASNLCGGGLRRKFGDGVLNCLELANGATKLLPGIGIFDTQGKQFFEGTCDLNRAQTGEIREQAKSANCLGCAGYCQRGNAVKL